MKNKNIINLIKYHSENNEAGFRDEVYEIAKEFDDMGKYQLSQYIMALISDANVFVPQMNEDYLSFFNKVDINSDKLPLPNCITEDIIGIVNVISRNTGINKFLFEGPPGTGKTESAKNIARMLGRDLYIVQFETIIDSKLGQTSKNISLLFEEIKNINNPEKIIILFDEIDAIAIDRINANDLREMGRATSAILKGLDGLSENVVLIATTNLFASFDKALTRRFDFVVNYDRYSREDLIDISEIMLNDLLIKFKITGRNMRLFRKIMNLMEEIPYPGELKNLLKTCVAFSDTSKDYDYLAMLYKKTICNENEFDLSKMKEQGLTVREIEIITGVSKSQVSRELKGE